tara:strand:- start:772 stop:993 length:222 start_codon:yes stop_codon:yes gene_type:complete
MTPQQPMALLQTIAPSHAAPVAARNGAVPRRQVAKVGQGGIVRSGEAAVAAAAVAKSAIRQPRRPTAQVAAIQ